MPLIEISAEFTRVAEALERIANGIEVIAKQAYGIDLNVAKSPSDAPEADVTWATDEQSAANEAHAELVRLGYPGGDDLQS